MTDEDCRHLAELLRAAWPNGVTWGTWFDALAVLEREPAERTYRALRDTDNKPPSVARFLAEYRRLGAPEPEGHCPHCDDTGYVSVRPLAIVGTDGEVLHTYSRVMPCTCPRGRSVWQP